MSIFNATHKYEAIMLRPEDEILLCCARTDVNPEIKDKILYLIENDMDWNYLLNLASRHRLLSLLYHNLNVICPEMVPEDILGELKDNFNANVRKNLMMAGELIKVLNLLESEGITAIPYKGPVLASMAYGNIGLREFGDIDIFVRESEALKAKMLLLSNDFTLCFEFNHITDEFYLKTQREYGLMNARGIVTEIHWDFHGPFFYLPFEPDFLYNDLKRIDINGLNVSSFTIENLLLILCIHNAKHDWEKLGWICDISELIKNHKIDWTLIMEKSCQLGIQRILYINFSLAIDLFELKVPDDILNSLNSDHVVKKMFVLIKNKLFSETTCEFSLIDKLFFDLKKRESVYYGIRDCILGLTVPSYPDFENLSLPKFLYPFYYLFRPFKLLKRYKI